MTIKALTQRRRTSLNSVGALLGIGFFLANSLVSSYSFRLVQNGFVFFLVLAIAAKFLFAAKSEEKLSSKISISGNRLKFGYALGIAACLLLTVHCLARVTSVFYSNKAQSQIDIEKAMPDYQTAFRFDNENPTAHFACGMNLLNAKRYPEAAEQFEQAIAAQRATSVDFSYLATAQILSGDNTAAEKTIARALSLYPFSTFVRTRYATLLKANGKTEEAAEQLEIALQINKFETNTWWTMMNEGAREASLRAAQNKDFIPVHALMPEPAIYAIVTEREIRYPEEKFKIDFGN
jgi:tetratricopeptide (TPR) repeat protein